MPRLPFFDAQTRINQSPHVVVLGAGASRAAFPNGDANGRRLPVMADLIQCLDLGPVITQAGFSADSNFESLYDHLATTGSHASLKLEIESRVQSYFEVMQLPESPTIYDSLLLSLRGHDYVATFNWDPFLARAFERSRQAAASLPRILFLHGNVAIGMCPNCSVKGFLGDACQECSAPLQATRLLYPVGKKDYKSDPFIAAEWKELETALKEGYMLTIFGYSAPKTDVEAVDLMLRGWGDNPTFDLAEVEIVDIRPRDDLEKTWERFLCRTHYGTTNDIWQTWLFRYPRRSCEAMAMATLQNAPWRSNQLPRVETLSQLHSWIAPLVAEEEKGQFSGNQCIQPEHFAVPNAKKTAATDIDWVLGWLKTMSQGGIIPPFCVDLVLTDGTRYCLHSIVGVDDQTRTMCARIWDLRALDPQEISELKQKLNEVDTRGKLAPAESLHPKLDWANLRLHYDNISYCVEWHDRVWPPENP